MWKGRGWHAYIFAKTRSKQAECKIVFLICSPFTQPAPKVATAGYGHVGGAGCNEKGKACVMHVHLMESTYLQGAWPVGGGRGSRREGERERDRGERGNKAIGIINAPSPPALLLICLKLYSFVQPVDHNVQRHSSYHAGGLLHSFPSCLLLSHVVLSLYLYYYTT